MNFRIPRICLALLLVAVAGCSSVMHKATRQFADNLTTAILNENDPGTVRDGMPAYLLLIDGLIQGDPQNADTLLAGAKLYGAYTGGFVDEAGRGKRLAQRAYDYARRATCVRRKSLCEALDRPFESFATALGGVGDGDIELLFGLGSAWASRIQQSGDDWDAVADIPKVQAIFEHVIALEPDYEEGAPYMVLGVLNSLRPASLGGKPERGRDNFERAILLSGGRNLMAKTLYAQYYARLVFDKELHDRLLGEVLDAAPEASKLTLVNTLAQQRARTLLESGKDYF